MTEPGKMKCHIILIVSGFILSFQRACDKTKQIKMYIPMYIKTQENEGATV